MDFEFLKTPRLLLRKVTPEVYDFVHRHYSDDELMTFFALNDLESLEKEKSRFANGTVTFNKKFLWFHLMDGKKNIGQCGYHVWYTDHARAEIFYNMFLDDYKRKGLMKEAVNAVIDFGFEQMKLHRIEAMIADYNIPSIKIVERFGFKKEGVLREHYFVDGKAEDSVVFSLLKREYEELKYVKPKFKKNSNYQSKI